MTLSAVRARSQTFADYRDANGHGTTVARLVLQTAPTAKIYVAKIANGLTMKRSELHRVTRVSPTCCSCGQRAHADAQSTPRPVGGNMPRAYPASRSCGVVCVHGACESDGLRGRRDCPVDAPDCRSLRRPLEDAVCSSVRLFVCTAPLPFV